MNINSADHWDKRFESGDWDNKRGRSQTESFARAQIPLLGLDHNFAGSLLDFGCGLGDAFPLYRLAFPRASLLGVDHSRSAIEICSRQHGAIACFLVGDHSVVPPVDVIIASNVLEHVTGDLDVAGHLLAQCRQLFVVVPYREQLAPGGEHVNRYDEKSFADLRPVSIQVFVTRGWSQYGLALWYRVHAKNIARALFGKPLRHRRKQVLFRFVNRNFPMRGGPTS